MTKIITISDLKTLIAKHGMRTFFKDLITYLKEDFSHWGTFHKMARLAAHVPNGVIELMPTWNNHYFSYKYVNGHPNNPKTGHLTVVALGMLAEAEHGYPLLFSEMTLLTAMRTAATSALASDLLAKPDIHQMTMIGTGAQSEFQVLAHRMIRPIKKVRYFDLDPHAMDRFHRNMEKSGLELIRTASVDEAVQGSDLISIATAARGHVDVLKETHLHPGVHINGIGGDTPGKTEIAIPVLKKAKIFIEYMPQTQIEGEIQRLTPEEREHLVKAELWEVLTHKKKGRESPHEITLFDSVGFAVEDYAALRLVHDLAKRYQLGTSLPMIPELKDPKDLISLLGGHHVT